MSIDAAIACLADDYSRIVLHKVIEARFSSHNRALKLYEKAMYPGKNKAYHFDMLNGNKVFGNENMYFIKEYFLLTDQTIVLDAGAFIGDTVREYVKYAGEFQHFYCVEPDFKNFNILQSEVQRCGYSNKITLFPFALARQNEEVNFSSSGSNSRICEYGTVTVQAKNSIEFLQTLDPKPTFIKMDIEGNELEVLHTITSYLQQYKPDLAVSIYHDRAHLWEIPILLHNAVPEYQLFVRHNTNYITETVCYATINQIKRGSL